jgi:predicted aspartyl protease
MTLRGRVVLLFGLLGLAACAANGPRLAGQSGGCEVKRWADVPVANTANLLFAAVRVNGTLLTMLVDTGAERTTLTEGAVQRIGLARDPHRITRSIGIGGMSTAWDAKVDSFVVGGTPLPVDSVAVGRFAISGTPGAPDGLLGADILSAFEVDFNMPEGRMTLYRGHDCALGKPLWSVPYVTLAGIETQKDRLLVPIQLDGVTALATLDTGAQLSSISERLALRVGATSAELEGDRAITAHGAAPDSLSVRVHRFRELRIGPAVMDNPILPVLPMSEGLGDALVGEDFMQGRRIWISYPTRQVFVTSLSAVAAR